MSRKLDELDYEIVRQLQIDARTSVTELAEETESSRPTITTRLKRLLDGKIIILKGGLNLSKLDYKVAHVGLEVRTDKTREEIETHLKDCPRVLNIFRTPERANVQFSIWGEDEQTINSMIESIGDHRNVNIVYTHYLGTPIHGDVVINIGTRKNSVTPCNKKCVECHRYRNAWCKGCPTSFDYKTP